MKDVDPDASAASVPGTQTLMRGIDVLAAVSAAQYPPRFGDIQAEMGLSKGTLHRLLAALIKRRMLRYDERTRRYYTGSRIFEMARRTLDQSMLIRTAKPELSRLSRHLDCPACLYVVDGADIFVTDFEDPDASQSRVVRVWPRERTAMTAAGLAIAASSPGPSRDDDPTPRGLQGEIDRARAQGYAIRRSDNPPRCTAAAAIRDEDGHPLAAIGVEFRDAAVPAGEAHAAGRMIAEAARRASDSIEISLAASDVQREPAGAPPNALRDLHTGRDFVGENPVWSADRGLLYWLDIFAPALRTFDPRTGEATRHLLPDITGGLALAEDGTLVLLGQSGLSTLDPRTHTRTLLLDPESDRPDNRFNTAAVAPDGAIWAGTMSLRARPDQGSLYRIDRDLQATRVLETVGLPKNVAWSPDGATLYFPDGALGEIVAYDVGPEGRLHNPRTFVRGSGEIGRPNGIACDAQGHVWAAMVGGWRVCRFTPDGRLERTIHLPVPMPMSLCLGGPDLKTLFITSTSLRVPPGFSALAPQSGTLLAIDVEVAGQPAPLFG